MSTKIRLTTKGMGEVLDALAKMGGDVDAGISEALSAGGELLADGMRQRVPIRTGNLRSQISTSAPVRDGNRQYISVGLVKPDPDTARYGAAQEYGWTSSKGHQAGQSYVRSTVKEDMGKARKLMIAKIEARMAR